jgi:hypothetical protein
LNIAFGEFTITTNPFTIKPSVAENARLEEYVKHQIDTMPDNQWQNYFLVASSRDKDKRKLKRYEAYYPDRMNEVKEKLKKIALLYEEVKETYADLCLRKSCMIPGHVDKTNGYVVPSNYNYCQDFRLN